MASPTDLEIVHVVGPGDLAAAMAIREVVFIEEQSVPVEIERDDEDPTAYHVLAQDHGHAIGTGRLVDLQVPPEGEAGRWGQIGRMAVLVATRRSGVGSRILDALEAEARRRELDGILLHAQVHATAFYERAGYRTSGPIFEEAGMPHVEMRKRFGVAPGAPLSSQPTAPPPPAPSATAQATAPAKVIQFPRTSKPGKVARAAVAEPAKPLATTASKPPAARSASKPAAKKPASAKPAAKKPAAKKPAAKKPAAKKPAAKAAKKPAAKKPTAKAAKKPAAKKPAAKAAKRPAAKKQVAAKAKKPVAKPAQKPAKRRR